MLWEASATSVIRRASRPEQLGNLPQRNHNPPGGWQGEVGIATTRSGITREKANEIAHKLLPLYKDTFNHPKLGQPFHELYNTQTIMPKQESQDCYRRGKETLSKLGLTFTHGPYD